MAIQTIFAIAGFDPSSGAGVTADLATIAAHGFFGASAITALTVQSTRGVRATHPVEASILANTLACLAEDLPPAAIKLGMLGTAENVAEVAKFLRSLPVRVPVVLDPVMRSSSGRELLSRAGVEALKRELLPLVDWVTPNLMELSALTGLALNSPGRIAEAARKLRADLAGLNVVATGGHLESADDFVVLASGESEWLRSAKIQSRATHGTGCAFSTALACSLASGVEGFAAAGQAKEFVRQAILRAEPIGGGNGPMNLLWTLRG